MFSNRTPVIPTCIVLVLGLVACAAPATAEPTAIVVTVVVTATNTSVPPTETPLPAPRATPTSAGPLSFPEPTNLDHWQPLGDGEYECTIIVRITGGAPPYTVHHDLDVFTTWETDPAIVFRVRTCGAIVHTITVESADGQIVAHDYAIPAPWCD